MNTVTLQIPMNRTLREDAANAVVRQGFSSLQEALRVLITKIAYDNWQISFEPPTVVLSKKNALRYDKMINDIKSGKVKTYSANNVDDLMTQLNVN